MDQNATPQNNQPSPPAPLISVVIPTLNEATNIGSTLDRLTQCCLTPQGCEVIMVDGGSTDATLLNAHQCAAGMRQRGLDITIVESRRGRAHQMNLGAEQSRGEILVFLHADTFLPHHFDTLIRNTLSSGRLTLGAFRLKTDRKTQRMEWICWWANLRARLLALPYGDQALFIRRADFMHLQMFPDLEIMEDFAFVRKVKRHGGRIPILSKAVVTSSRRWNERGCLFTTLCNQIIILGYHMNIPTRYLARWYRR